MNHPELFKEQGLVADKKKPVEVVCTPVKEFMAMDFSGPASGHHDYARGWRDGCAFKEKELSVFRVKTPEDHSVN